MTPRTIKTSELQLADVVAQHPLAADQIFPWVSPVSPETVNGYRSFFIPPDGSKEGWLPSDEGDDRRQEFIDWLNAQAYDDGGSVFDWAEVGFGELGYEVERNDHDSYLGRQAAEEQAADAELLPLAGTPPVLQIEGPKS